MRKGREVPDENQIQRRQEGEDSLDFSGFGVSVRTKGREVALVALFIAVVSLISLAGYIHHTEMMKYNTMLAEQVNEMIYILSLPPDKRETLNLAMPRSLRMKVRAGPPAP